MVLLASRLPRLWVRVYTLGLDRAARAERCREIDSDTYEHIHDDSLGARLAVLDVIQSLVLGMPDDLRWRAHHISPTGNLVQSALAAAPVTALAAGITLHTTGNAIVTAVAAVCVELIVLAALLALSYMEATMRTTDDAGAESRRTPETWLTALSLLAFPALLLAAQTIIPFADGDDPIGDKAELTSRAAEHTTRWVAGYGVLAIAVLTAAFGVVSLAAMLRRRGAVKLGMLAPLLVLAGSLGVLLGIGVYGFAVAQAIDAGLDAERLIEGKGEIGTVVWWLGSITFAVGLLLVGTATWQARLFSGWMQGAVPAAFALEALAIGLLPGLGGAAWSTLPAPIIGFVAFGLVAWRLVRTPAAESQPVGSPAASFANG
ncbi:MAG TPA: hypothetical protein VNM91_00990 [Dehalococcoidia bacterium]|nr:hypothetical protein [Dehalococcoidia bacterium]